MKNIKQTAIVAVAILFLCFGIVGVHTFATEPVPDHVNEKLVQVRKRIESLEAIDAKLKPKKQEVQELQDIRDLLDADLQADVQSLDRWGYSVDWNNLSVHPKDLPSQ